MCSLLKGKCFSDSVSRFSVFHSSVPIMISTNAALLVLVVLSLEVPGMKGEPTSNRNEITYASRVSPLRRKEQARYYDEGTDTAWMPESKVRLKFQDQQQQQQSGNFYDPNYGFSPEIISDTINQNKNSKGEPILTAVLVNSKDYYRLFDCDNPKVHFDKNTNHQISSQEVDNKVNIRNQYASVNSVQDPHDQQNNAYYNRVEKREQSDTADPSNFRSHYDMEDKYFNINIIKAKQIPHYFKNTSDRNIKNPNYSTDSGITQAIPVEDNNYQDKLKSLEQLFEEFSALSEQIQRLRAKTESELSRPRVRRGRPRVSYRGR